MHNPWVVFILMVATLVIVPLALEDTDLPRGNRNHRWGFIAAGLLLLGFLLPPGISTGWLSIPWFIYAGTTLARFYCQWTAQGKPNSHFWLLRLGALVYLCIGCFWAVADRFNWQPLGFDPLIVLLTAVHFHYAGFALLWIAGKALVLCRRKWEKHLISSVIIGVPLTAIGITTSHWQWTPIIEVSAVGIMALGGIAVGSCYLRTAFRGNYKIVTRSMWAFAGLALILGMVLAVLYGIRYFKPIPWLSIPWMYWVHGTLNSLGFSLMALLGFWWQRKTQSVTLP